MKPHKSQGPEDLAEKAFSKLIERFSPIIIFVFIAIPAILILTAQTSPPTPLQTTNSMKGETVYFYHVDDKNVPIKMTDKNGNEAWSASYDPFMKTYTENNPAGVTQPLRYPGQYYDKETGLHYNMNRYYAPSIGRYIQPDPQNIATIFNRTLNYGGNQFNPTKYKDTEYSNLIFRRMAALRFLHIFLSSPELFNPYSYALSNPINKQDPFGIFGGIGGFTPMGHSISEYPLPPINICKKFDWDKFSECMMDKLGNTIATGGLTSCGSMCTLCSQAPHPMNPACGGCLTCSLLISNSISNCLDEATTFKDTGGCGCPPGFQ